MRLPNRQWCNAAARCFSSSSSLSSHIGSQLIPLPASITCDIRLKSVGTSSSHEGSASVIHFSGPKGFQDVHLRHGITASVQPPSASSNSQPQLAITCQETSDSVARGQWGLTRAMCANAVKGLSEGFLLPLRLVGVGYRASVEEIAPISAFQEGFQNANLGMPQDEAPRKGRQLVLRLGFPRPVRLEIPHGIECEVPSPSELRLTGPDKQQLAQFAARIRQWRRPEPYNGKGIFVGEEKVTRKEVKKK